MLRVVCGSHRETCKWHTSCRKTSRDEKPQQDRRRCSVNPTDGVAALWKVNNTVIVFRQNPDCVLLRCQNHGRGTIDGYIERLVQLVETKKEEEGGEGRRGKRVLIYDLIGNQSARSRIVAGIADEGAAPSSVPSAD